MTRILKEIELALAVSREGGGISLHGKPEVLELFKSLGFERFEMQENKSEANIISLVPRKGFGQAVQDKGGYFHWENQNATGVAEQLPAGLDGRRVTVKALVFKNAVRLRKPSKKAIKEALA